MKFLVIFVALFSLVKSADESKDNKIVGGMIADSIPHQVAIFIKTLSKGILLCGGSIISEKTVLTAAHCFRNSGGALVILGASDLAKNETGVVRQTIKPSDIKIHPHFNFFLARFDIALVVLPTPVTFSRTIQPVKLPSIFQLQESFAGEVGTVSGFGQTCDDCGSSAALRFTENRVMTNEECGKFFGFGVPSDSQLCLVRRSS
jgi:chymotrypsin